MSRNKDSGRKIRKRPQKHNTLDPDIAAKMEPLFALLDLPSSGITVEWLKSMRELFILCRDSEAATKHYGDAAHQSTLKPSGRGAWALREGLAKHCDAMEVIEESLRDLDVDLPSDLATCHGAGREHSISQLKEMIIELRNRLEAAHKIRESDERLLADGLRLAQEVESLQEKLRDAERKNNSEKVREAGSSTS